MLILLANTCDGNAGSSLLVDKSSQPCLALDDAVWHILLPAESWHPANHLDGINIMRNDDKLGLLLLDECRNMIQAILQHHGLLGFDLAALLLCLGSFQQPLPLLLACFRLVLLAQPQQGSRLVLVNGMVELVDRRRNLQSHKHDALLALQADVLGPLHEAVQVCLWSDVTADAEVLWVLLKEDTLLHLLLPLLGKGSCGRFLLGCCLGCCLLTHAGPLYQASREAARDKGLRPMA
mmetsp:Transcript_50580/g.93550  ORF Transcript_50580/g.93550 Transcript_50580/m.93550 type:complete len:236 (+) Transcript_50580:262-969(+)